MAREHTTKLGKIASGVLAAGLSTVMLAGVSPLSNADPGNTAPVSASDAVQKLTALAHQSEQLNQEALRAQGELDKKQGAQDIADKRLAADTAAIRFAEDQIKAYGPIVDKVAAAMYEGARTDSMFAILGADAPQQLLDQMSLLQFLGNRTSGQVDTLNRALGSLSAAKAASAASADAAHAATRAAAAARGEVHKKQSALSGAIAQVSAAFGSLSAKDRQAYIGTLTAPGFDANALLRSLPKGSAAGALAAAFTRIGDPYVWGATGPDQFDCSGLVQWAFRQVGKSLPRTSQAQAEGGTPVAYNDLQPGDVVTFYSDVSHVGIYVGNGNIVHASTFGVPVGVAPMSHGGPFHNARRY